MDTAPDTSPGRCPAVNPASGYQCSRRANGHNDHEADLGDVKQMWTVIGSAVFQPGPTRAMSPLPEIILKETE